MTTQDLIEWVESFTSDSEPYRAGIIAKLKAAEELALGLTLAVSPETLARDLEAYYAAGGEECL